VRRHGSGFAVHDGEKLNFVGAAGKDAVKAGAHAGKLLGAVSAVTGGKGGGRPDSATSGGKDITKVADAPANTATMSAYLSLMESHSARAESSPLLPRSDTISLTLWGIEIPAG